MKNFLCFVYWLLCLSHTLGQTVTVNQIAQNQRGQVQGNGGQLGQNQGAQIVNSNQPAQTPTVNQLGQNQAGQVRGTGGQLGQNQGGQIVNSNQPAQTPTVNQLGQSQAGQVRGTGGQLSQNQGGQIVNSNQPAQTPTVNQLGQNQVGQVRGNGGQLGQNQGGQILNNGQNTGSVNQLGQNQIGQVQGNGGQLGQNQGGQISNQGPSPMSQIPMGQMNMNQNPMMQNPGWQNQMGQNQMWPKQGQMDQKQTNAGPRNRKNLNVGNPDEGFITRPCQPYDTQCIREFFAEHGKCKKAYGPIPEPYHRKQVIYYVPRVNLTATVYNQRIKGLNGRIQDFYVNEDTDKVVLVIEYRGLEQTAPEDQMFFRFHRRSKEPVVTKGSSSVVYPSVVMTAIIPKINKLDLQRMVVFAFVNDPAPPFTFSPSLFQSTDPQVQQAQALFFANLRTVIQELFLTDGPFYPALFIQRNLCDFGLELL